MIKNYWTGAKRAYHHTAPVSSVFALYEALNLALEEGLENHWERHREVHLYLQLKLEKLGFLFLVEEKDWLPNLNAVLLPAGVDEVKLRNELLNNIILK